jgi:Penicillin binding protein transpeptidase domain/Penicillin-binding Protein dimerisation domain
LSPVNRDAVRRRRVLTRALPVAALATAAFIAGAVQAGHGTDLATAQSFADQWESQDFAAMHADISPGTAKHYPLNAFTDEYGKAQETGTVTGVSTGDVSASSVDGRPAAAMPVTLDTRAFGRITGEIELPLAGDRVAWSPDLVFPGLEKGGRLVRDSRVPKRAPILARGGAPLAEGPASARSSPLGSTAESVAGAVSSPNARQNKAQIMLGFPPDTPIGTSGLEQAFNRRLAGRPGGRLVAVPASGSASGRTVIATTTPVAGTPVHTTIDPTLQQAATTALGGLYGGVAVLDATNGSVLAIAGLGLSGPQPPGSTFKVVTTTAALDTGAVKLTDEFPIQTSTVVAGREIANAHNESCGGTFVEAFAESCNSVFVPLGPKVGSKELVGTAERYGFNAPPSLFDDQALKAMGPPESTLPTSIPDDVDLAVTAIGQGEVLATPLEMASVAQTVANGGVRSPNSMVRDPALQPSTRPVRVTSKKTAAMLRELMIHVVTEGTGTAAALPGIQVAGKTGTAELGPKPLEPGQAEAGVTPEQNVDAWFTGFAPAAKPKLVAAAMVINASADGGTVAAPIVRQVLDAGLG